MDLIHLITLFETPERESKATSLLQSLGLKYQIHRFQKNPVGWKGCLASHLELYKLASSQNLDYIFICEDNISLSSTPQKTFKALHKFLRVDNKWDVIYLGGYIHKPWLNIQSTVYPQVFSIQKQANHGTVCYIIHKRCFEKIIELSEYISQPIDIFLARFNSFAYSPFLFHHSCSINSSVNPEIDFARRIYFHPITMKLLEKLYFCENKSIFFGVFVCLYVVVLLCVFKKKEKQVEKEIESIVENIVEEENDYIENEIF